MATETIILTPTWAGLLPALLAVREGAESAKARNDANAELNRLARIADRFVAVEPLAERAFDILAELNRQCAQLRDAGEAVPAWLDAIETDALAVLQDYHG